MGVPTTAEGVEGLVRMGGFEDIRIVFDATSAKAHVHNSGVLEPHGVHQIDLTPRPSAPTWCPR